MFDNDGTLWCEKPMQPEIGFLLERLAAMAERRVPARAPAVEGAHEATSPGSASDHEALPGRRRRRAAHGRRDPGVRGLDDRGYAEEASTSRARPARTRCASAAPADGRLGDRGHVRVPRRAVVPHAQEPQHVRLAQRGRADGVTSRRTTAGGPIVAVGNSAGDREMLEYAAHRATCRRRASSIDHDDAEREFAYAGASVHRPRRRADPRRPPSAVRLDRRSSMRDATGTGCTHDERRDDWATFR